MQELKMVVNKMKSHENHKTIGLIIMVMPFWNSYKKTVQLLSMAYLVLTLVNLFLKTNGMCC